MRNGVRERKRNEKDADANRHVPDQVLEDVFGGMEFVFEDFA